MSYIVRNQYGAFCSVCQHHLGFEEDSFDSCDVCGGEGFPDEQDDDPYDVNVVSRWKDLGSPLLTDADRAKPFAFGSWISGAYLGSAPSSLPFHVRREFRCRPAVWHDHGL